MSFCFIGLSEAVTQKIPFHGFASAFLVAAKPKGEEKVLNYCTSLLYIVSTLCHRTGAKNLARKFNSPESWYLVSRRA